MDHEELDEDSDGLDIVRDIPPNELKFLQASAKTIILDPQDEQWDSKMRFWKHRSDLCNKNDGVSFSLMFRVVVKEVLVRPENAQLMGVELDNGTKQAREPARVGTREDR